MTPLRRLLARLRGAVAAPPPRRVLYVHEDDMGDVELLPEAARAWCAEELRRIDAFAAAHEAPDGLGWTDIHVRPPAPARLGDLGLRAAAAAARLRRVAPAYDGVETGTYSDVEVAAGATAFGADGSGALVLHVDAAGALTGVDVVPQGGAGLGPLLDAVRDLAAPSRLVAVAWNRGALAALDDPGERAAFIRAIAG
ncbi:MAG: hypothetical protein IPK81_09070 [Rhodospirillales bacterium]|nr:MAG: hypothetical protein IPK81_09070 [Rhodospirillales bacterium]